MVDDRAYDLTLELENAAVSRPQGKVGGCGYRGTWDKYPEVSNASWRSSTVAAQGSFGAKSQLNKDAVQHHGVNVAIVLSPVLAEPMKMQLS
ncbi:predicted protein [Plenodomus lingam JN3]|uniref:Predicted protein n=1 Tax=Leptosphaeria maculans (strain JN3 / isolate v23.1.3 / race Av1-4-5-6-7-8) TaxID=985895 RepID=E4ZQX1_LEPMJ|nr:predicted protein [Plenodomus lingam JN3]CBX94126.1 predicted protein [Plenodomus lingam JN3]